MAIESLTRLLKEVILGDETALITLLTTLQENQLSQNDLEQVHAYLKANALKEPHAIYVRALLFDHGHGVKADDAMAFLLMREAAAKGDGDAIYEVGHRFLKGQGVDQNYQNALQWLEIAATSPYYITFAMRDLSDMYSQGLGTAVNEVKASFWKERAGQK